MKFSQEHLAMGTAPACVEMAIQRKHSKQQFLPTLGNERGRPTLRELQYEKYKIMSGNWCHRDSWCDLEEKLLELQQRGDVYACWEPYQPDHTDERMRSFKCFVQHKLQHEWMQRNVQVLFLDSTHNTNNYGMQLFIGATQMDGGLAIPLFFFMCSVDKKQKYQMQFGLEWMLQCVYARHPEFCPTTIIMDHDLSEHNAVAAHLISRAEQALSILLQELKSNAHVDVPVVPKQAWPSHVVLASSHCHVDHTTTYIDCVEAIEKHKYASQVSDDAFSMQLFNVFPTVIPPKPSIEEYRAFLVEELSPTLSKLQQLNSNMTEHNQQDEAWADFVDWAEKFCYRHARSVGRVADFCSKYLQTVKLLCEFHTKKSWTEKLNGSIKDKKDRKSMYRDMVRMMRKVTNWTDFSIHVKRFVDKWDGKYHEVTHYFCKYYFCDAWRRHWDSKVHHYAWHNQPKTRCCIG
jgi:MULE transposase domain